MFKKILFFVFVCFFSIFTSISAQNNASVTISTSPKNPKTNQDVTISLNSYSINLNNAKISWFVNGNLSIEEIGKKRFVIRAGNAGTSTSVEAVIQTTNGSTISEKIIITPADIDLLWEASDSYVPPFYKGKALPIDESTIKVVALPNKTQTIAFSYKWKQDDNNQPDDSGYGKNSYVFKNSYLDDGNTISVDVTDFIGNSIGSGKLNLQMTKPKIIFYNMDLQNGINWNNSLGNSYNLSKDGGILVAEPYFFTPKNIDSGNLIFDWSINNEQIPTPETKNILSIKQGEQKSGSANIILNIKNAKTFFQNLETKLLLNF